MLQQKQASQAAIAKAWSDPDFAKTVTNGEGAQNGPGFDPNAMMSVLMSGKYGKVLPDAAGALVNGFLDRSSKVSEAAKNNAAATKDAIESYQQGLTIASNAIAPILDR